MLRACIRIPKRIHGHRRAVARAGAAAAAAVKTMVGEIGLCVCGTLFFCLW